EGVPPVEDEQLVQQRGAGAPVADDEDRLLADADAVELAAVQVALQPAQQRVEDADRGDDEGDVEVRQVDGEAVARQEAHPGQEVAALPDVGRPFALRPRLGWWWFRHTRLV